MMNDNNLTKAEKITHIKHFLSNTRMLLNALEEDIDDEDQIAHYMSLWTASELHDWLIGFKKHVNDKFQEIMRNLENQKE